MSRLKRTWLRLGGVTLVAGVGLAQLGAKPSSKVDAVDLGTLGGDNAFATAVNSLGHVVGQSETADGQFHAFLWREGKPVRRPWWDPAPVGEMTDLGTLPDLPNSWAEDVNDHDQVVGTAIDNSPGATTTRAFIWQSGQLAALATLPGYPMSIATHINSRGEVVGFARREESAPVFGYQAVIWQRGVVAPLPALPGYSLSMAFAINDLGDIGGVVFGELDSRPVVWRRGVPTELAMLPGYVNGQVQDINRRGQVVGYAGVSGGGSEARCVLWDTGVMIDLGMLPGHDQCVVSSIDDLGQIVGDLWNSQTGSSTPFIWKSGVMIDLNAYVPPDSGWHLGYAYGIDGGAIVGRGGNANGDNRAFALRAWTFRLRH